jgi:gamma-glutamylcyclotransferase (GGCT)/AIG2-like uncharacterized protein YtfP
MYRITRKVYLITNDLTQIDLHFSARTIPSRPYRTPFSIIDNLDQLESSHRRLYRHQIIVSTSAGRKEQVYRYNYL